ncbi:hypothetical protein Shyhy01_53640 [Streptomyces hygroscopicus subsp. hygroscopicus]|nr:hypothetical protein Shyhy01_53640 [Streptomyces hygroscopicus subsp. hygroscopicus]
MASHVDQFCSTQLAAFVALSWASWSVGTAGAVPDGAGDGDAPAAFRTTGKDDTAGTSRCCTVRTGGAGRVCEVTKGSPDGQHHHTNGALCVPRADPPRRGAGETGLTLA